MAKEALSEQRIARDWGNTCSYVFQQLCADFERSDPDGGERRCRAVGRCIGLFTQEIAVGDRPRPEQCPEYVGRDGDVGSARIEQEINWDGRIDGHWNVVNSHPPFN